MTRLRSCNACSRHVFATEAQCPFCGALLAAQDSAPIFNIKAGMSRAQRFALVAAVASQTLVGCSKTTTPGTDGGGTGSAGQGATSGQAGTSVGQAGTAGDPGGGRAQPVYGAPVTPVNPGMPGGHAGTGSGVTPVYGAPVTPLDAGKPRDSGAKSDEDAGTDASTDAGKDAGPRFHPVYGAPIPIYGAPPRKQ